MKNLLNKTTIIAIFAMLVLYHVNVAYASSKQVDYEDDVYKSEKKTEDYEEVVSSQTYPDTLLYANQLYCDIEFPVIDETHVFNEPISQKEYGTYTLEWSYSETAYFDMLTLISNGTDEIRYTYDKNNNRKTKNVNGSITNYDYMESGLLNREYNEYYDLLYLYNEQAQVVGLQFENEKYVYNIENDIITDIVTINGNPVAHYEYDGAELTAVYEYTDDGMVLNNDKSFIGNVNGYVYRRAYIDRETGWYYSGRYIDVKNNRYVDGISPDRLKKYIDEYGYCLDILYHDNTLETLESDQNDVATCAITTSNTQSGRIEIISRVIYGESHYDVKDVACVASVIRNRVKKNNQSAYAVVTSGEFSAYNGSEYHNMPYSNLNTSILKYIYQCAVALYSNSKLPSGHKYLTEELYFCSVNSALTTITYDSKKYRFTKKVILNNGSTSYHYMYRLYFVPFGGYFYSLSSLGMQQAAYSGKYNVFYK